MPFDTTVLIRMGTAAGYEGLVTTTQNTINLGSFGTYPNGIILQLIDFHSYQSSNNQYLYLRVDNVHTNTIQPTSSNTAQYLKFFAPKSTADSATLGFVFKATETPSKPIVVPGFSNSTLTLTVLTDGDLAPAVAAGAWTVKIRIVGY